ncbi:hypothetical protein LJB91_02210 [Bacteroidales bacterium OttesenSCG-928-L03]|nr:hypothetical protein [Bacteroidales bacterium OttesenSCG-928-L03]
MKKLSSLCFLFILVGQTLFPNEFNRDSARLVLSDQTLDLDQRAMIVFEKAPFVNSAEERHVIYEELLLPYVEKEIKDPVRYSTYKITLHLALIRVYSYYQDVEAKVRNMEAAVAIAEKSEKEIDTSLDDEKTRLYNNARANVYRINGQMHSQIGSPGIGHEYLYKAIRIYESIGSYERAVNCLYMVAIDFTQIGDANGLHKVVNEMQENLQKDRDNYSIRYNLHATETSYYDVLLKQDSIVNYAIVDSLIQATRRSIFIIENHRDKIATNMVPAWVYYALASAYNEYHPQKTDSIFLYLDKTLGAKLDWDPVSSKEVDISVNRLKAIVYFREKQYSLAEQEILSVLQMMDEMNGRNPIQPDYMQAYRLMVDISGQKQDYKEALKYMTLLRETEQRMYDQNKINAINDVTAKYETEKKEARILNLLSEKKAAQHILWLTIGLAIALLIAFVFVILFNRLKRKSIEQRLYETALTAELRQNELEKIQSLTAQLEQNPVQNTIENISELISSSLIDKDEKKKYLERINKIDSKLLQQVYQTAKVKITNMDMKYIICFSADMDVKDISLLFNIEPASVHTVRYRIRKKFSKDDAAKLLI